MTSYADAKVLSAHLGGFSEKGLCQISKPCSTGWVMPFNWPPYTHKRVGPFEGPSDPSDIVALDIEGQVVVAPIPPDEPPAEPASTATKSSFLLLSWSGAWRPEGDNHGRDCIFQGLFEAQKYVARDVELNGGRPVVAIEISLPPPQYAPGKKTREVEGRPYHIKIGGKEIPMKIGSLIPILKLK